VPFLKVQTSATLDSAKLPSILREASALLARELGKPEAYVMVKFEPGASMVFASTDSPCAFVELKSLGLVESQGESLSRVLCDFLQRKLGVPANRIYIEMTPHPPALWGWNSETFG
jgi:hypothetical protein